MSNSSERLQRLAKMTEVAQVPPAESNPYLPPIIERLGSLAELTQGGTPGLDDGLGNAGDSGSV